MQLNLSSRITLERVPQIYYRLTDEVDAIKRTRYEKLRTEIYASEIDGSKAIAGEIAQLIRNKQSKGENCVLGLSGGLSPLGIYAELVRMHKEEGLSFSNVVVFNVAEFYPLASDGIHTNTQWIKRHLLDLVDIPEGQFYSPGTLMQRSEVSGFCRAYELDIEKNGGLDLVLVSVGLVGNIAYNEPGSQIGTTTRLVLMDNESRRDLKRFYASAGEVPFSSVSMGLSTLLGSRQVFLVGWGEHKAAILKDVIEGKADENIPAALLQLHKNARAFIDLDAAQQLTRLSHPWLVGSCEWTDKMIRRAIVWLCRKNGKPILKQTNKDYNQNGLDELLALYGSAYNVNVKIFSDLQHTITGWPGGKPNADDVNRPERAIPYPKRVLILSPHPDDDVISMGGTLQRLVDQQHEVHVAYQTSGNIAVGDEEVVRYISLMQNFMGHFDQSDISLKEECSKILHYLLVEKQSGDLDPADVLFVKGQIRREEAISACRFSGVNLERVHFLDLPFYETGKVQKDNISEKDVNRIIELLRKVQPHQVYVAGDLADPHGTHKVCLDAVLAAIYELKEESWMKECRVWMYRGAWAEWEIDHIEMAVPISPEQLRKKRHAILKHQSQMESAPFLGNDERLFWQRAEERNCATAQLYNKLGLPSYEAIEAFVE